MKKTFRKALACLLAVLMVAFSLPFTALARDAKEWWVEDGIELSDITSEPDYIGFADDEEGAMYLEDYEITQNEGYVALSEDAPDLREYQKPVLAATVTSLGEDGIAGGTNGGAQDYYNKYYGYSKAYTFDAVNATGHILNPGQLKAGQRIAVTYEMGGFDILASCMVKAYWNPEFLEMGYYSKNPTANNGDTWAASEKIQRTGGNLYPTMVTGSSGVSSAVHQFNIALATSRLGDMPTASTYIGKAADIGTGKYGIVVGTVTFRVLQDCDLKDVLTYDRTPDVGTIAIPYETMETSELEGSFTNVLINAAPGSAEAYAVFAEVWENYSKGDEPAPEHVHDYTETTMPATCTEDAKIVKTCSNADGQCDAVTVEEIQEGTALGHDFAGALTSLGNGKHTVQCTRCDATETKDCTFTATPSGATCTEGGSIVYTCDCGYSYTESNGAALGHDMQVVKEEITTPATCEADGVKTITYKCSRCDETETKTETIAKLGHDLTSNTVTTPATCEADGSEVTTTTCSRCDYNDVQTKVLEKLGHDLTTNTVTTPATCEADGSEVTTTTCSRCDYNDVQTKVLEKLGHDLTTNTVTVEATYDADGSVTTTTTCSRCDYLDEDVQVLPMLVGIQVTVANAALGTATVNGKAVEDEAVTANCAPNSDVVLTATPVDGAVFVGWNVDGKLISTAATVTVKALADITYVPVFQNAADTFTVVFVDRYGNIFATQNVTSGAEIDLDAVQAPAIAGYTFVGWSVEDVTTITGATTIQAVYEKNETAGYTVTAAGCSITAGSEAVADVLTGVEYDTLVTVTAEGAKAWTIIGATLAYGDAYTFYVG
ncbi:MAG: hypothetical protein K2F67_01175, partial [Eubacterium sp.]|nr:hypothetical protein [Eubacterium sp.]